MPKVCVSPSADNTPTGGKPNTSISPWFVFTVMFILSAQATPVLAAPGPDPATWIPGTDVVENIGSMANVRRQAGPYQARDVFKTFVPAVAGKDLRLIVTGSTDVKVDYFDERRDNGLYAIFGSVDPGTLTLKYQWSPAGANTWTDAGTTTLTAGAKRTMNHDTEVPICTWYDTKAGAAGGANPTAAQIETRLNTDFINLKADGFNCVHLIWLAAWNNSKSTIYSNLTQHGIKIQQDLYKAVAYVQANMVYSAPGYGYTTHHNVPLLGLETALNTDMLADVGGGVALKNHPQLFSYYLDDECIKENIRGQELTAMLAKNLDPNHGSGASAGGLHGSFTEDNIAQAPFSDFIVINNYPFRNADTRFNPGGPATAPSDFSKSNWQSGQYGYTPITNFMDWAQSFDPRRPLEVINQTHEILNAIRHPSPKELRALVMIAAAHGSRPFTYFFYGWTGNMAALLDDNPAFGRTPQLDEAKLINAKLASWMPTYKNLNVSTTGSTPITYSFATKTPIVGNFTHKTTGDRYLIVVNTDTLNTKTVTVNGVLNKTGGTAATATSVPDGTVHTLTSGTLAVSLPPGDGALLGIDQGVNPPTPTSCHLFTPGGSIPPGFASPWNVFTQTLTVQAACHTNNAVLFTVGDAQPTTYIWKNAYYTKNGSVWQSPFTWTGSNTSSDQNWFISSASFTTPALTATEIQTSNSLAVYLCTYQSSTGGGWKCGCKDSASCTSNGLWVIQGFKK